MSLGGFLDGGGEMHRLATWVLRYDSTLVSYVNRAWKCRVLDLILPRLTHIGGATVTITFLIFWYLLNNSGEKMWACEGLLSLGGSSLVVQLLKYFLPRIRPYIKYDHLYTFPNPLTDYSFPSGHTTAAFSIATTFIIHDFSNVYLFLPLALIVGYSRIYLALHYPTDVFIGACIGSGTAISIVSAFS